MNQDNIILFIKGILKKEMKEGRKSNLILITE